MDFFTRLRKYYASVASVLRGEADAASVFPNSTDIGTSRERVYAEFLRLHAPSKCNVFLGGFLFDGNGTESKQLDVIVTTDTTPRFDLNNKDSVGKSFSPVEGTLGVASIKSVLDRDQLFDALDGIASIPPTDSLAGRVNSLLTIRNYEDWPYKVVFASRGLKVDTIIDHLVAYYGERPHVPLSRRPNIIHVAGEYVIIRGDIGFTARNVATMAEISTEEGVFYPFTRDPDIQGICWVIDCLQGRASASNHIIFRYEDIVNRVLLTP